MRRATAKILAIVFVLLPLLGVFSACTPRENVLKIYNWGDYMDLEIIEQFEEWYLEEYEEEIKVQYYTFNNNETMYSKYRNSRRTKPDYDLVCPSEYMIEQMLVDGALLPLSREEEDLDGDGALDYTNIPNMINVNPVLRGITYTHGNTTYNFDDYVVPYMWGTFGIMYNIDMIEDLEDVTTWSTLLSPKNNPYAGQVSMKDSVRDAIFVAALESNKDELLDLFENGQDGEHQAKVQEVIDDTSNEALAAVESILKEQKKMLYSYESDLGKEDMVNGKIALGLMWSGDAAWAFYEDYELENQDSVNIAYYVPHEGSNVWTDGFVIPKYARNVQAAEAFLNFLCDPEIAYANMDYCGYTTAVEEACETYKEELWEDEMWEDEKFLNRPDVGDQTFLEWYQQMYIDTMFPPDEVLNRCAVMHYFGDKNNDINKMWNRIRA